MRAKLYCCSDYEVDSDGYIISKRFNRPLKPSVNKSGYQMVTILVNGRQKGITVHKAVARTFLEGYQEGLEVNHKDGNKQNNNVNNLEWVTRSENQKHCINVLGKHIGANNVKAKAIYGFDKITGELKYSFDCIADGAKELCNNDNYRYIQNSIWRVLNGKRKTYKDCIWKYQ